MEPSKKLQNFHIEKKKKTFKKIPERQHESQSKLK